MASILRTGKLLRYFAGFTRNVVVNSMRDCETNNLLQSAPCLCSQFQNGFASNAAATKAELSLDRQIKRLDQDARRIGRISRRDLEEVLDEIRTHRTATSSQSLLVIRCCGNLVPEELPEVRTALVQEIWKTLNALNVPMDISHYNALLRVYLENEHQFTPTDFLAEIEAKGIEPNRVTYQRLIGRYCQQGDIEGATRILEFMRGKSLPVNENVFNSLILGHSQANDLESAKGILGVMKQAGLEPSADTYTTLLCAFARHGDIEALHATLAECEPKEIILLDKDLLDIMYTLTINGHGEQVDAVLAKLRISPGFNQDAVNVILRLVNKGYEDVALKLLRLMPRSTRVNGEQVDVGAFYIRQLVKANRPVEKILSICRTLQAEGLNPKALTIATEAGLTNGVMNNALPLLQEMKNLGLPIRQHYFWPLICNVESSQVLDIVRRMQQEFALNPNSETIRDYVIPNLKEKNWERIVTVLRDAGVPNSTAVTSAVYAALTTHQIADAAKIMEQNRVYYVPILFRQPLILALSNTNDFASFIRCVRQLHEGLQLRVNKEATEPLEELEQASSDVEGAAASVASERHTPDIVGGICHEAAIYFRRERVPMLEKIFEGLIKQGLSISSAKATALSDLLGAEMTPKLAEQLGKLSSGDLEPIALANSGKRALDTLTIDELERFIKNVEAKGESGNNIKRQLLNACFRSQNLEKTLQVIERFEQEKFQIPIGIYAQLVDLYTFHKRSTEAIAQYNKLRTADATFKLDNFKAVRLADLLLQEERMEQALQLLQDNQKETLYNEGEGSFNYISTVWRILNAIAETGDAEKLRKIFDALVTGNYVVPTNVLLGPLIKVHLTRDDIPKAIDAFEQICQQHKATPWKNELACRLIQKEDAANLQRLTDLSTSIHGEVNSLYDLVFSFVECGRVRQARKILETPGLRTRPQRISTACDRYKNEGMLQPLEGLIEATKDLGHIDRNKIYYTLLLSYDKADEAEKALGLWTKMQEEAVTPTDAFLLRLAELLRRKNMDVPFVVPETTATTSAKAKRNKAIATVKTEQQPKTEQQKPKPEQVAQVQPVKPASNIAGFRRAIQNNDPDGAIAYRARFISGDKVSVLDTSRLIELLVRGDRLTEASKYVDELLADKQYPQPKIFKYYLNKIAASGDIEALQRIGNHLTDDLKRVVSFDNRYCHAFIVAGKAEQFLKQLSTDIEAAKTPEEAAKLAEKFPRGGAVGILDKHPELVAQYESVAEKYAAQNQLGPMNVLWMHLISNGQEVASKQIWDKHLSNAPRLMFQRVLQTAREQQDEKLASTVIAQLRDSKISEGAIGNAYSCLIDIQTTKGNTDKALEVLANAIKDVSLENINRTALLRLKGAVEEKSQKFPYTVPEKRIKADESSSSSSGSSSSDDDVKPKKPETVPTKPEPRV